MCRTKSDAQVVARFSRSVHSATLRSVGGRSLRSLSLFWFVEIIAHLILFDNCFEKFFCFKIPLRITSRLIFLSTQDESSDFAKVEGTQV